jgi:hypothetical protein
MSAIVASEEPERSKPIRTRTSLSVVSTEGIEAYWRIEAGDTVLAICLEQPWTLVLSDAVVEVPWLDGMSAVLTGLSPAMALGSPQLLFGDIRPNGLAAFIHRPSGAGPLLLGGARRPLQTVKPGTASQYGLAAGREAGFLAFWPKDLPQRLVSGLWFAPGRLPLSGYFEVIGLVGYEPGLVARGWFEPGRIGTERIWTAFAWGTAWQVGSLAANLAAAAAWSAGFPGADTLAWRIETRAALGRLRLDAEAAGAPGWRSPDGTNGLPLRIVASLTWQTRALSIMGMYRLLGSVGDVGLRTRLSGQLDLRTGRSELRVASGVESGGIGKDDTWTVDTRIKPGLLPWLVIESAWMARNGLATRFDLATALVLGSRVVLKSETGIRCEASAWSGKAGVAVMVPFAGGKLELAWKTEAWRYLVDRNPTGMKAAAAGDQRSAIGTGSVQDNLTNILPGILSVSWQHSAALKPVQTGHPGLPGQP